VSLPKPEAGLVIRYSYLWHDEHLAGRDDGVKDRPCAMILVVAGDKAGREHVLVLPVTHSPPRDKGDAVEIPSALKARIGLDSSRSWVVVVEHNDFVWPGPDIRRVGDGDNSSIIYGKLPSRFLAEVQRRYLEKFRSGLVRRVPRTE
jgi:hypothetical protein